MYPQVINSEDKTPKLPTPIRMDCHKTRKSIQSIQDTSQWFPICMVLGPGQSFK